MAIFFIADPHFNHKRIIETCNRPFKDVVAMNTSLINNWNSVVNRDDTVFVLGDVYNFVETKDSKTIDEDTYNFYSIISSLKGHKYLIKGNHDTRNDSVYLICNCFEKVYDHPILYNNFFLLSHEPLLLSNTTPYFNLYGHVHTDDKYQDTLTSKCVCVERTNYTPISLEKIMEEIYELSSKTN